MSPLERDRTRISLRLRHPSQPAAELCRALPFGLVHGGRQFRDLFEPELLGRLRALGIGLSPNIYSGADTKNRFRTKIQFKSAV
jgi:hypothetical protein